MTDTTQETEPRPYPTGPNAWTTEQPPPAETPTTPPPVVMPETDSRLDQLLAEWWATKAQADALAARVKELSASVKTETLRLAPEGATDVMVRSPHLPTPYRVCQREDWRLDSKALKEQHPEIWVWFAKQVTSWRLDPVK